MRLVSKPLSLLALLCIGAALIACRQQLGAPGPGAEAQISAGTLVAAGTMHSARAAHTATALPDGRVLLAGGFTGDESSLGDAEMFDPAAAAFVPAGPMGTRRQSHSATRLPDGRVLLAGGYDAQGQYLAGAELFDPARGTFSPTGAMQQARANHVALRLDDGRVLLVGGVGVGWTFLASAEVYDPASGTFTPTGSMNRPRGSHAVVRLPDGRVLVAGGHRGRRQNMEIYTNIEVYNPATGTFSPAGEMVIRRHKHDAVLLPDGQVLITGGTDERDAGGRYTSAELYDPRTGTARLIGPMQRARYKHQGTSVVLPGGQVLLAGGATQAEVYDPETGTFHLVEGDVRMLGQFSAIAPLPDGGVLVTGGYGEGRGPQAGAWRYRP